MDDRGGRRRQQLGIGGINKSEISQLCASPDEQVEAFRTRGLDAEYPSLWLDARYKHVREDGRVVSMAVVVAYGVREVLGIDVRLSEGVALWREFLQDLVARGLRGAQLVVSDAHAGLRLAIAEVLVGAAWQRCRVHTIRTQRRTDGGWARRPRRIAPQRDDVPNLQRVLSHNDPLDHQLQGGLLRFGRRFQQMGVPG